MARSTQAVTAWLVTLGLTAGSALPPAFAAAPHAVAPAAEAKAPAPPAQSNEDAELEQVRPAIGIAAQWLKRPELQRSLVGLEIMDIPSGRVLFSSNGGRRFVTASIAKVLTTACIYDTLGASYTYKTVLEGFGEIHGGRLTGPLVIVPSQDPSFKTEDLRELLSGLQGRVHAARWLTVAAVAGGGDRFGTEWLVQDWGQDWMPASSDFVVDRNVAPARDPGRGYAVVTITSDHEMSALSRSLLQSAAAPAWVEFNRAANNVSYFRPDQALCGDLTVGNPTEFNAALARVLLHAQGVKLDARDAGPLEPQSAIVFSQHTSRPLADLVRFTLKESDNLYAQQFVRTLGTLAPLNRGLEKATLEERGLARINAWLTGVGVPQGDAIMYDGCGLSRKNAITPHALNVVLRHMATSGNAPYIDLLIHEGEGNARNFRFKTGAMDSVRSISGVIRTSTGHPLALTAIVNDHLPSVREIRVSLNALVTQLQSIGTLHLKPVASNAPTRGAAMSSHPRSRGRRHRH